MSLRRLAGCVLFLYLHSLCVGVFSDAGIIRQHGDSTRHTRVILFTFQTFTFKPSHVMWIAVCFYYVSWNSRRRSSPWYHYRPTFHIVSQHLYSANLENQYMLYFIANGLLQSWVCSLDSIPSCREKQLQSLQNYAARLVTNTRKYENITLFLKSLYWLPVIYKSIFNVVILTLQGPK